MATRAIGTPLVLLCLTITCCHCLFDNPLSKTIFHVYHTFTKLEKAINNLSPIGIAVDKITRGGEPAKIIASKVQTRLEEAIRQNRNGISEKCATDLLYYAKRVNNSYVKDNSTILWNRQLLDAYGTLSINFDDAYRIWAGDYEQCLKLEVYKECDLSNDETCDVKTKPDFEGKYCLADVNVKYVALVEVGMCFPSTCSAYEMSKIFRTADIPKISVALNEKKCHTKHDNNWDTTSIVILILFVTLTVIVFVSTIHDILTQRRKNNNSGMMTEKFQHTDQGKAMKMLMAFSAYRNTEKIFNTKSRGERELECIDGIRAITMSWIVIGHVAAQLYMTTPFKNPMETRYVVQDFWMQCLINAEFAVDTFIFMTGFLLLYTTLKHLTNTAGKLNLVQFYFHRIIRITPAYAITLAFICGLFQHTSNGPFWPNIKSFDLETCRRVWWRNLLYINVYFEDHELCMTQSWYLCLDTFYYAVSPLLFLPIFRKPKLGIMLMVLWIISSILLPGYLVHAHELASMNTWQMKGGQREDFLYEVYSKPWNRMHVFLIGMVCGLIYHRKRDNFKMNKIFVSIMWLLVAAMMLALIYGTHPFSSGVRNMTRWMFTLYGALSRPAWAIGIGWITLACLSGYGGVINTILTWKLFVPISRLSYSYYLVHYSVIVHYFAHRRENFTIELYIMSYIMISAFFLSSIFAYILSMLTESPMIELEKVFLGRTTKSTTEHHHHHHRREKTKGNKVDKHEDREQLVIETSINDNDEIERGYDTADSEIYWDLKNETEKFENSSE